MLQNPSGRQEYRVSAGREFGRRFVMNNVKQSSPSREAALVENGGPWMLSIPARPLETAAL